MSKELEAYLTEKRSDPLPERQNKPPNRRNGSSPKTVTTGKAKAAPDIPRDRSGCFDLVLIAKYQRRFPFARQATAQQSAGREGSRPRSFPRMRAA